jgi:hypothetical protein
MPSDRDLAERVGGRDLRKGGEGDLVSAELEEAGRSRAKSRAKSSRRRSAHGFARRVWTRELHLPSGVRNPIH